MKTLKMIFLTTILTLSASVLAHDFPTDETVRYVLGCMADNGGLSDENLYSCSCRLNTVGEAMTYAEYEEGITFERNKDMPGEKGGFFRSSELGEKMYHKLTDARKNAEANCPIVKHVVRTNPQNN